MFELGKVVGGLLSPLSLALALWGLALLLVWRRRWRLAIGLGLVGLLGLWAVVTRFVAHALVHRLESRFPALPVDRAPQSDAILVLGGALAGASPPLRPSFDLGSAAGVDIKVAIDRVLGIKV